MSEVGKKNLIIKKEFQNNPEIKTVYFTKKITSFIQHKKTPLLAVKMISVILSSVKEEQKRILDEQKLEGNNSIQASFDDYFNDWDKHTRYSFKFSFKDIKLNKDIRNDKIAEAFILLSNLNWEIYQDNRGTNRLVPFIEAVEWNNNSQYFSFMMQKETMQKFLEVSQFFKLDTDFIVNINSSNTLNFVFWMQKFIPSLGTTISLVKAKEQLGIEYKYLSDIKRYFNDIKINLNSSNYPYGMNFSINKRLFKLEIFLKKEAIGEIEGIDKKEDLQIQRTLYYTKRKRKLSNVNFKELEKIIRSLGYQKFSQITKRKIGVKLMDDEYIQELIRLIS